MSEPRYGNPNGAGRRWSDAAVAGGATALGGVGLSRYARHLPEHAQEGVRFAGERVTARQADVERATQGLADAQEAREHIKRDYALRQATGERIDAKKRTKDMAHAGRSVGHQKGRVTSANANLAVAQSGAKLAQDKATTATARATRLVRTGRAVTAAGAGLAALGVGMAERSRRRKPAPAPVAAPTRLTYEEKVARQAQRVMDRHAALKGSA